MIKEFEGRSEQEAIEKAIAELQIEEFEVEILETEKAGFFKKANVRIRVHYQEAGSKADKKPVVFNGETLAIETEAITFLEKVIALMGYTAQIKVQRREREKIVLEIVSDSASILIGKKGKNLDALQLIINAYTSKNNRDEDALLPRIILDIEDYRRRQEELLVKQAIKSADMVAKNKRSRLLEPMNPFERRLVHTALSNRNDIITQSEGEGLYKQVRIIYKGSR
ncbi:MAG: protein jag [Spirochaetaceae bacterium]|nr:protein jag [Spirochaetaceae bacterium]